MQYEGVEPTNEAKRALRRLVVRRRTMCKSSRTKGMRRMELELSCRTTWKMRGLNLAE